MRTAIGSDHAGFEMKIMLARFLRELCEVVDGGTHIPIRCNNSLTRNVTCSRLNKVKALELRFGT
jgi:ribose 5-phosphate isomerase RpiB